MEGSGIQTALLSFVSLSPCPRRFHGVLMPGSRCVLEPDSQEVGCVHRVRYPPVQAATKEWMLALLRRQRGQHADAAALAVSLLCLTFMP